MSKFEGKQLSYAVLHQPIHTPFTGQFGPVLVAEGDGIRKGTKMTVTDDWVSVEVPAKNNPKEIVTLLIPITGFTHTVLAK